MKALVSFHPIDLAFFDEFIAPLVAGDKVNPETFLVRALRMRRNGWAARSVAEAVAELAAAAEPPKPDPGASRWTRLRANMEKIDYRPGELVRRAARAFDFELHIEGRPFFIAENSTEKVGAAVDAYVEADSQAAVETIARGQLALVVAELAGDVLPVELPEPPSDLGYRDELLGYLRKIHELARAAREGRGWIEPDVAPRAAAEALPAELPWRALAMHARVNPFWIARDVDGLETICRAAGVRAPDCLSPAWRVLGQACDEFPALKDVLGLELQQPRDVGAFVAPGEIADLILFLSEHGARIIAAAARGGEGPAATTLLRKIKECAVYAQRHGFGYLEASGVAPVWGQTE